MKYMKGAHNHEGLKLNQKIQLNRDFTTNYTGSPLYTNPLMCNNGLFNNTGLPWQTQAINNFNIPSTQNNNAYLFPQQMNSYTNPYYSGIGYPTASAFVNNSPSPNTASMIINKAIQQKKIINNPIEQQKQQAIPKIDGIETYAHDTIYKEYCKEINNDILIVPANFNNLIKPIALLRYAKILATSSGYFFRIYQGVHGGSDIRPDKFYEMYISLSQVPRTSEIRKDFPFMQLHPTVELLLKTLEQEYWRGCNPNDTMYDGELAATHCDKWVDKFRAQFKKTDFTDKVTKWENEPIKQYKDTVHHFNLMLEDTQKPLNVVRVDLSVTGQASTADKLPKLVNAFETLMNACHNKKVHTPIKGIVWRLEHTERKAFHYHCIFFCDNTEELTQEEILGTIGEYWKYTILKSDGVYYNCNEEPSLFRGKGSGVQDFSNQLIQKLFIDEVLPMLTLVDLDLRVHVPDESLKRTSLSSKALETSGYWFAKHKQQSATYRSNPVHVYSLNLLTNLSN